MPIHNEWLVRSVDRYGFDNVDEVLRHLIYTANSEPKPLKKLIFKTVRCLHCHVGARAHQHVKIDLVQIAIHTFHYEWLLRVTEACKIASVEKCVRIIVDYYQSRVQQVFHSEGPKAASNKELELFGRNRHEDPRYIAVLQQEENEKENEPKQRAVAADDPAACSQQDMIAAIQRCQVGRHSATYALAMKETAEETKARRAKEIVIEESDESKLARIRIRQALHMG